MASHPSQNYFIPGIAHTNVHPGYPVHSNTNTWSHLEQRHVVVKNDMTIADSSGYITKDPYRQYIESGPMTPQHFKHTHFWGLPSDRNLKPCNFQNFKDFHEALIGLNEHSSDRQKSKASILKKHSQTSNKPSAAVGYNHTYNYDISNKTTGKTQTAVKRVCFMNVQDQLAPPQAPPPETEEEVVSLQPIGPGLQNLEPEGSTSTLGRPARSPTPSFPIQGQYIL